MARWREASRVGCGRRALLAAGVAGAIALSGCSSTFTAQPYTPGVGTNMNRGDVKLRAMVLVVDGDRAWLTGSVVTDQQADTLTGIDGVAQDSSGNELGDGSLTFEAPRIEVPAGGIVDLTKQGVSTEKGKLVPGLNATLTLTFQNAGEATLVVPVVDTEHPDYKTFSPSAPASQG